MAAVISPSRFYHSNHLHEYGSPDQGRARSHSIALLGNLLSPLDINVYSRRGRPTPKVENIGFGRYQCW
ncbi:hypothetical protein EUGRSUZ_A00204 [Eucalyptus grandis]|uniref:Uncharacterized protein n=2 Tax=Eucalyptus grandis TaxID=71139 RepID=A0ACC3LZF9_EUCGR|nr:hypothetical protein EUGRSUZ_A00204 [Eucalyptus grandis]